MTREYFISSIIAADAVSDPGAWYLLSHYPDLVIGGLPASGWLKINDYVPYSLSVAAHYRDRALDSVTRIALRRTKRLLTTLGEQILLASLSQFDNDLYASNLVGINITTRHGSMDDNVPVQHSRQMATLIDAWSKKSGGANSSLVR